MAGILVRDAMKIYPFSRATLAAGEKGLTRKLTSANIQEVPDVQKWLHGGELLFTSGYSFKTAENGMKLLKTLKEKDVAGIAIKTGEYLEKVPQEMLDCANELDFPLFILPEDLPYMDCIVPILDHITKWQVCMMKHNEELHEKLLQIIVEGKGIDGICSFLSEISGGGAAIVSPKGCVMGISMAQDRQGELNDFFKAIGSFHFSITTLRRMKKNKCNKIFASNGDELLCIPIFAKKDHLAFFLLKTEKELNDQECISYEQAGTLIAVELLKEQEALYRDRKVREQLLDDLLSQRYTDEEIILKRGRFVGFDFMKPSCVFVLGINDFELKYSNLPEHSVQKLKSEMMVELLQRIDEARMGNLIMTSGVKIIGLMQIKEDNDRERIRNILCLTIKSLKRCFRRVEFTAGLGLIKNRPGEIPKSYEEADQAMTAGGNLNSKDNEDVFCFEELGCLTFIGKIKHDPAMKVFYNKYMQPLITYDEKNGGILIETLEKYFKNGMNIRKTAGEMYVHKNSIIYRLDKIESLLGTSLSSPDILFDLQLCLKIRQLKANR